MSDGEYQMTPSAYEGFIREYVGDGIAGTDILSSAKEMNIKDLVKGNYVHFDSFRQGVFYYKLAQLVQDEGDIAGIYFQYYIFPVPIDDIGTATLMATDKALTYMRWIRKAISDKTFIKI